MAERLDRTEAASSSQAGSFASLFALLSRLYEEQLALTPGDDYLAWHGRRKAVEDRVFTYQWYRPLLPRAGTLLDWGCNHSPDSCLIRADLAGRLELHSCDFGPPNAFPVFAQYAETIYKQLEDDVEIPYRDGIFDVVIGSGVLEHTATDSASLEQVFRILKPGGVFIGSCLPNWLSLREWHLRVLKKKDFHLRTYSLRGTRQLLKHSGLHPEQLLYHTYVWKRLRASLGLARLDPDSMHLLSRSFPPNWVCSSLCFVARKPEAS